MAGPTLVYLASSLLVVAAAILAAWAPVAGIGIVACVLIIIFCARSPRRAFTVWLISIAFIPVWVTTSTPLQISISSAVGLIATASAGIGDYRFRKYDAIVVGTLSLFIAATMFAGSPGGELVNVLSLWGAGYFAARILVSQTGTAFAGACFAKVMAVVGALAVLEFTLDWHVFEHLLFDNLLYTIWSPIQERGGVSRSEWAFGHSIALGGALSLALPFAVYMRTRLITKIVVIASLILGVTVTFSRGALLSVALSVAIAVLFGRRLSVGLRLGIVSLGGIGLALVLPLLTGVFTAAGDEVTNSGAYRGSLLSTIPLMSPIGISSSVQISQSGFRTYGRFTSIDSSLIAVGLDFGLLLAVALAALYAIMILRTLFRQATLPELALTGQLPLILTVAFITQWQMLIWIVVGMAAVALDEKRRASVTMDTGLSSTLTIGRYER